jgi:hypothetical protein
MHGVRPGSGGRDWSSPRDQNGILLKREVDKFHGRHWSSWKSLPTLFTFGVYALFASMVWSAHQGTERRPPPEERLVERTADPGPQGGIEDQAPPAPSVFPADEILRRAIRPFPGPAPDLPRAGGAAPGGRGRRAGDAPRRGPARAARRGRDLGERCVAGSLGLPARPAGAGADDGRGARCPTRPVPGDPDGRALACDPGGRGRPGSGTATRRGMAARAGLQAARCARRHRPGGSDRSTACGGARAAQAGPEAVFRAGRSGRDSGRQPAAHRPAGTPPLADRPRRVLVRRQGAVRFGSPAGAPRSGRWRRSPGRPERRPCRRSGQPGPGPGWRSRRRRRRGRSGRPGWTRPGR